MARFTGAPEPMPLGCDALEASVTGTTVSVKLADPSTGTLESLAPVGDLRPAGDDKPSQLEEVMFLVVTQYVTDVFDLLRERPVAVLPWPDSAVSVDLKATVWPVAGTAVGLENTSGRVRFIRLLRSRPVNAGGFEDARDVTPTNLFAHAMFGESTGEQVDMNPLDARGMILGISTPLEWVG
jgi:hypothetical protein